MPLLKIGRISDRLKAGLKAPLVRSLRPKARSMKLPALHPRTDKRLTDLVEDSKALLVRLLRHKEQLTKLPASQPKTGKRSVKLEEDSKVPLLKSLRLKEQLTILQQA